MHSKIYVSRFAKITYILEQMEYIIVPRALQFLHLIWHLA
jgi:hypothetical protein